VRLLNSAKWSIGPDAPREERLYVGANRQRRLDGFAVLIALDHGFVGGNRLPR
jgi:hypothetical protein